MDSDPKKKKLPLWSLILIIVGAIVFCIFIGYGIKVKLVPFIYKTDSQSDDTTNNSTMPYGVQRNTFGKPYQMTDTAPVNPPQNTFEKPDQMTATASINPPQNTFEKPDQITDTAPIKDLGEYTTKVSPQNALGNINQYVLNYNTINDELKHKYFNGRGLDALQTKSGKNIFSIIKSRIKDIELYLDNQLGPQNDAQYEYKLNQDLFESLFEYISFLDFLTKKEHNIDKKKFNGKELCKMNSKIETYLNKINGDGVDQLKNIVKNIRYTIPNRRKKLSDFCDIK